MGAGDAARSMRASPGGLRLETAGLKGAGFAETWSRLQTLIREDRASREDLEDRLGKEALALVDAEPIPSLWYPVAAVDELTELVAFLEGPASPAYYRAMGARAFDELISRPAFATFVGTAQGFTARRGESLVKLAGLVYNFGEWSYKGETPTEFVVEVQNAAPMAEFREWTSAGFIERLMEHIANEPIRVTPERPTQNLLILRGTPRSGSRARVSPSA
jgi:hypothetical protein